MSYEGGVTSSDRMRDILPPTVTPEAGEGALGTWRIKTAPDIEPDQSLSVK
jgi:hypothetical protein